MALRDPPTRCPDCHCIDNIDDFCTCSCHGMVVSLSYRPFNPETDRIKPKVSCIGCAQSYDCPGFQDCPYLDHGDDERHFANGS